MFFKTSSFRISNIYDSHSSVFQCVFYSFRFFSFTTFLFVSFQLFFPFFFPKHPVCFIFVFIPISSELSSNSLSCSADTQQRSLWSSESIKAFNYLLLLTSFLHRPSRFCNGLIHSVYASCLSAEFDGHKGGASQKPAQAMHLWCREWWNAAGAANKVGDLSGFSSLSVCQEGILDFGVLVYPLSRRGC